MLLHSHHRSLDTATRIVVVGILNVTPDSYVDGGNYASLGAAVERAKQIIAQGGDIIEIGGEATGPGSADVSEKEERQRVLPVIQAVRKALPNAWISVDTFKASVAADALKVGADMINDITAGRGDADMFAVVSRARCPYVMMFAKDGTSRTTREARDYADVVAHVRRFLTERIEQALQSGIDRSRIIIDPGLGHFVSAKPEYSFEILRRLAEFTDLAPVFVSPSRKSFLAGKNNDAVADRLPATLTATEIAVANGASFLRTHDVRETRAVCDIVTQTTTQPGSSSRNSARSRQGR